MEKRLSRNQHQLIDNLLISFEESRINNCQDYRKLHQAIFIIGAMYPDIIIKKHHYCIREIPINYYYLKIRKKSYIKFSRESKEWQKKTKRFIHEKDSSINNEFDRMVASIYSEIINPYLRKLKIEKKIERQNEVPVLEGRDIIGILKNRNY